MIPASRSRTAGQLLIQLHSSAHGVCRVISSRDVVGSADGAERARSVVLIDRSNQEGVADLREAAPRVDNLVPFVEDTLAVLEFGGVFDDQRIPRDASVVAWVRGIPLQGFEKEIEPDFPIAPDRV